MATVIQVQHSSDHDRDGKWFDLEHVPDDWSGPTNMARDSYIGARMATFRKEYGRPVRRVEDPA
ncbi:hypothetical protein [Sphingobium abikonense]|uniref:hypothetical protein n=1 Tax=Sphingobium abikonense TaxID=86193 RepID=UPI003514E432